MGTGGNTTPLLLDNGVLRRITPAECAKLQGFPGDYCVGLEDDSPTAEDLAFWQRVWDQWMDLQGKRHKSERQVRKWLVSPPTDSAQYKMWGNGMALPVVHFLMHRIIEHEHKKRQKN